MRLPISAATVFVLSVGLLTMGEALRIQAVTYAQQDRISGPNFAASDFHFGQIESESGEWLAAAAERGSLGRETSHGEGRGVLRADRGRFCYSVSDIDGVIKPGRYCYRAVVRRATSERVVHHGNKPLNG